MEHDLRRHERKDDKHKTKHNTTSRARDALLPLPPDEQADGAEKNENDKTTMMMKKKKK